MKLLEGARNRLGPLSPETKARVQSYLSNPSAEAWNDVRAIVVRWDPVCTLDSAVRLLQGSPPPTFPDAVTLARAISVALRKGGS